MRQSAIALLAVLAVSAPASAAGAVRSPAVAAPTHVAKVRGAPIAYRSFGAGPPLVLVMGFGGTMDAWDPALLDRLALRHRLLLLDNRGAGESAGPTAGLSIHSMGEDTVALARRLGLRRFDLLGWSMGGFISQDIAVQHPRLVHHLVLTATAPPGPLTVAPFPDALQEFSGGLANPAAALDVLFTADQAPARNAYVARILQRTPFTTVSAPTIAAQLRAIRRWTIARTHDDPRRIAAPTLVADGSADRLTPPANSRILARRIRGAKLVIYRDAAHGFLAQYHSAYARAVLKFLAR